MSAYYNEFDPKAAAWLRELIKAGHIAPGDVDERSIADVRPDDLRGYSQCHFFAGIGGWSYALRLAGISDDTPIWTGICPCQPFSAAGKQMGRRDSRHLFPAWARLIRECRPATVFGEQVASSLGREWFAGVRLALEVLGYEVGGADLCAAGVGSPNIRQRIYWVANAAIQRRGEGPGQSGEVDCARRGEAESAEHSNVEWLADTDGRHASQERQQRGGQHGQQQKDSESRRLADPMCERRRGGQSGSEDAGDVGQPGKVGFWDAFNFLPCTDGKARRVEPGSFPLAHGIPGRVGLLRGYGNAIVPQVAAAFIQAATEAIA